MKKFEWTVWLPLLGLLSMLFYTQFGRYRTIYFAGTAWSPYQMMCFAVTIFIFAVK